MGTMKQIFSVNRPISLWIILCFQLHTMATLFYLPLVVTEANAQVQSTSNVRPIRPPIKELRYHLISQHIDDRPIVSSEKMDVIFSYLNSAIGLIALANDIKILPQGSAVGDADKPDFIVRISDSKIEDKALAFFENQFENLGHSSDAFTFLGLISGKEFIVVNLFWDQINYEFKEGKRLERTDAFARLLVALNHEILGNVLSYKAMDPSSKPGLSLSKSKSWALRVKLELAAFRASIESIDQILDRFGTNLTPTLQSDLRSLKRHEQEGFASWRKASEQMASSSLKSNILPFSKNENNGIRCRDLTKKDPSQ